MIIEIGFGKKAMWISIFVFIMLCNCAFGVICGIAGSKKSANYDLGDSLMFLLFFVLGIGWWFAE